MSHEALSASGPASAAPAPLRAWLPVHVKTFDSEIDRPVIQRPSASTSGIGELRPASAGLPDPAIAPPVVAESGDPSAALRVTQGELGG